MSSSEELSAKAAPPLLRPDRQFSFDDAPHYEWPNAKELEDRDTITVDRIRDDIDGPSHRFVIHRGDTVEAYFSRDKQEVGEAAGISHSRREVRVRFDNRGGGIWFAVGQIYPALEACSEQGTTAPLSAIVEQASQSPAGGCEADRVAAPDSQSQGMESLAKQHQPFVLADYGTFLERLDAGELTIEQLKTEFARLTKSRDEFVAKDRRNPFSVHHLRPVRHAEASELNVTLTFSALEEGRATPSVSGIVPPAIPDSVAMNRIKLCKFVAAMIAKARKIEDRK